MLKEEMIGNETNLPKQKNNIENPITNSTKCRPLVPIYKEQKPFIHSLVIKAFVFSF